MLSAVAFTCEAYDAGPDTPDSLIGACFVELADGKCPSRAVCAERMSAERQRTYRRIQELGADGGAGYEWLADEFTRPDQLLGGPDS
jgi:hypothetical protein